MTDLKQTATLMTPRRGFFTRVAGVMALGAAAFIPTASRAEGKRKTGRIGRAILRDVTNR